ncbi:MAG: glycosyltransferase family 4 protein, partial [Oscillospiraceae bacterium]|nr:glycosyltransferase family 4 protein [Oscillospiraceae bacterium]
MKIAFVAPASSIHTARWVNSLSENNIDITLFSLRCHRDIDGAISDKVKITYLAGKNSLAYFTSSNELRKHLDNEDFDLVNTHYASGYGTLARLAKARPMLLNVWGS